jgi:hypothetical protein
MAANPEMPTPKPSFMYILSNSGKNLRDTDALDLLRTFLKKPTNYYILELSFDENLREPVLRVCVDKKCSEDLRSKKALTAFLN